MGLLLMEQTSCFIELLVPGGPVLGDDSNRGMCRHHWLTISSSQVLEVRLGRWFR